jgi:transcription elongation factor
MESKHTNFKPGDRVRLLAGESKGIVGTVEKVLSADLVSVVLNRKRTTYMNTAHLRFVRHGIAPGFTNVWLGEVDDMVEDANLGPEPDEMCE